MNCQAFVPFRLYDGPGQCKIKQGVQSVSHKGKRIRGLCGFHRNLFVLNKVTLYLKPAGGARGSKTKIKAVPSLQVKKDRTYR